MGFGWKVLLSSDEFFLTGSIYGISSMLGFPRSERMSLVLGRIRFQGASSPLFMLPNIGQGIVTIHKSHKSDSIVKILAPWSLAIFEGIEDSEDQLPMETPTDTDPKRISGKNLPKILIDTMTAARQKAFEDNDPAKASYFSVAVGGHRPCGFPGRIRAQLASSHQDPKRKVP